MTTVINNPGNGEKADSGAGVGVVLIVIVLIVVAGLFFIYALPAIRKGNAVPQNSSIDVNVKLPAGNTSPSPTPSPSTP